MALRKMKKKKNEDELLTKLHTAETAYHVVKYIKKGVWPEQLNREGDAPIHYYIKRKDKNRFDCLMAFLIHTQSDRVIDLVNNDGMTALHLCCERNDYILAKALIAFDADLNLINYENCTPLDIVVEEFKSKSEIPQLLLDLGGRYSGDIKSLYGEDYVENPMASYFLPDEPASDDQTQGRPQDTIRTRFGLDLQLMSIRRSLDGSLSHDNHVIPAHYYSELEFHDGRTDEPDDDQPISIPLESLPEEEEPPAPLHNKTVRFRSPDETAEMGLTDTSIALAVGVADITPDSSVVSGTSVLKNNKFLNTSPRSVSPVSPLENSTEEEPPSEKSMQPSQADLAKAYDELFSPVIQPSAGTSYRAVRNPMSFDSPDTSGGWVNVNGHPHPPQVTFNMPEEEGSLAGYILVNGGDKYTRFKEKTSETLEKAVESAVFDDDEGYAAWLQWKEMVKAEKRKEEIRKLLNLGEDERTSPVPHKPPPKPPTVRHNNALLKHRKPQSRQRQFLRQNSTGSGSLTTMMSLRNPHVGVFTSILGSSVAPFMRTEEKGEKVLCLDGGGIKGLIQIEVLKHLEEITGKRVVELFDWIVGTSTGGILALALVYGGRTLDEMKKMYFELKDVVFRRQSKVITTACDTDALEDLLKRNIGESIKMRSIQKPKVLITAVDKRTTNLDLVFFNNCFNDDYTEHAVWKVARYTSAAPLYFRELDNYVDGGVKANNPCLHALTRIQTHLRDKIITSDSNPPPRKPKKPKLACLLSIGCGVYPPEPIGNTDIIDAMKLHKIHNIPGKLVQLVTMLTSTLGSSDDVALQCQNSCEEQEIPYFRFNPKLGATVKTDETDNEKLCDLIIGAKKLLYDSEEHLSKLVEHLTDEPLSISS